MLNPEKFTSLKNIATILAKEVNDLNNKLIETNAEVEDSHNFEWILLKAKDILCRAESLYKDSKIFIDGHHSDINTSEINNSSQEGNLLALSQKDSSRNSNIDTVILNTFDMRFQALEEDKRSLRHLNEDLRFQISQLNKLNLALTDTIKGKEVVIDQLFNTLKQKDQQLKELRHHKSGGSGNLHSDHVYGDRKESNSSAIYYNEDSSDYYIDEEDEIGSLEEHCDQTEEADAHNGEDNKSEDEKNVEEDDYEIQEQKEISIEKKDMSPRKSQNLEQAALLVASALHQHISPIVKKFKESGQNSEPQIIEENEKVLIAKRSSLTINRNESVNDSDTDEHCKTFFRSKTTQGRIMPKKIKNSKTQGISKKEIKEELEQNQDKAVNEELKTKTQSSPPKKPNYTFPQKVKTVKSRSDPMELKMTISENEPLYKILYGHDWKSSHSLNAFKKANEPSDLKMKITQNQSVSPLFRNNDDITITCFKSEDSFIMTQFGIGFILVEKGRTIQIFRHPVISSFYDVVFAGSQYILYDYFTGIWSKPTYPSDLVFSRNIKLNPRWTGRSLGVTLQQKVLLCNQWDEGLFFVPILKNGSLSQEEVLISSQTNIRGRIQDFKTVKSSAENIVLVLSAGGSLVAYRLDLEKMTTMKISECVIEILEGRKEECFTLASSDKGQFIAVHLMMDERLASRIVVFRSKIGLSEIRPMSWIDLYKRNMDYFQIGTFLPSCSNGLYLFFFIADSENQSALLTFAVDVREGVKVREIGKLKRRIDLRFPRKANRLGNCIYTSGYGGNLVKILYKG